MDSGLTAQLDDLLESGEYTDKKLFEVLCPYYMSIGMTYEQFWKATPEVIRAYFQAEKMRIRRSQTEHWYGGAYMQSAIASCFNSEYDYPSNPFPVIADDIRERAEAEREKAIAEEKARWQRFFDAK